MRKYHIFCDASRKYRIGYPAKMISAVSVACISFEQFVQRAKTPSLSGCLGPLKTSGPGSVILAWERWLSRSVSTRPMWAPVTNQRPGLVTSWPIREQRASSELSRHWAGRACDSSLSSWYLKSMATAIRADQMYFEQFTCVNLVSPIVRSFELLNNTLNNFLSLFTPHGPDSGQAITRQTTIDNTLREPCWEKGWHFWQYRLSKNMSRYVKKYLDYLFKVFSKRVA